MCYLISVKCEIQFIPVHAIKVSQENRLIGSFNQVHHFLFLLFYVYFVVTREGFLVIVCFYLFGCENLGFMLLTCAHNFINNMRLYF
jgi:hypothetical protein